MAGIQFSVEINPQNRHIMNHDDWGAVLVLEPGFSMAV
jgi:hypothetical protein